MKIPNTPVDVIVPATRETFWAKGYAMANRDIDRYMKNGGRGDRHFEEFGLNEGRRMVSRDYFENRIGAASAQKYQHFKHLLDMSTFAPRFLEADDSFPVALTDTHFSADDYLSDSANCAMEPFIRDVEQHPEKLFMDLGSGLRDKVYSNCLYVEVYPTLTTDLVVGWDCIYPIKSGTLDGIACAAVLEHVQKPWVVAREIHRMLKPGGVAYIDYPFLQPVHGYPSHFFNATQEGLKSLFDEGFVTVEVGTGRHQGPDYTVSWILGDLARRLPSEKSARLYAMSVRELLAQPPQSAFWKEMLECLPDDVLAEFSCGNTLIAKKI